MGDLRSAYKILIKHRWKANIKINLEGIMYENVDWIQLAQGSIHWWNHVNMEINVKVP
jgi:hypothetical protein